MNDSFSSMPNIVDIAIIGGGVIGTVTAYKLCKAGFRVLVIERNDIGSGTSSSAAAAALLQTKTSPKKLSLANRSLNLLDTLHQELDGRFEYAHTGSLLAASTEDENQLVREMNDSLKKLGLNVELLDGKGAREQMPILGEKIVSASYSPNDAQINPLELVVACAQAAKEKGAFFSTFTKPLEIESTNGKIQALLTDKGRIKTQTIINAAGVWSPQIAAMANIPLPVTPLKGELMITERMPRQMHGTLIAAKYLLSKSKAEGAATQRNSERTVGITLVQVEQGNFVIGSTRESAGYDKNNSDDGIRQLATQLLELTPSLGTTHLLRTYAGLRPITPDGAPIISCTPGLDGLIHATGFGGDGLAMSAISADLILGMLTDNADAELLENFSLARFHKEIT